MKYVFGGIGIISMDDGEWSYEIYRANRCAGRVFGVRLGDRSRTGSLGDS